MTVQSWSPEDHIRHYLYESIHGALARQVWDRPRYRVLDFCSRWFGDEDGGWRTHLRTMLKGVLGRERVDHVAATYPEYDIEELTGVPDHSIDILVADQVLEHVQRPWKAAAEIARVTARGGVAVVATPGLYPVHPSPLDCWRIMPDGYRVLFPGELWELLVMDSWGNQERVGWEYLHNGGFPYGPPVTTVEAATQQPYYTAGTDGRCPLQLWWVGRRR